MRIAQIDPLAEQVDEMVAEVEGEFDPRICGQKRAQMRRDVQPPERRRRRDAQRPRRLATRAGHPRLRLAQRGEHPVQIVAKPRPRIGQRQPPRGPVDAA